LVLSSGPGLAQEADADRQKIAVLNLHSTASDVNFKFATHLTDKVREVVRKELPSDRYLHVSKEQILKLEAGWNCEESKDNCKMTVAKQLRVDLFVSGEIGKEGDVYLFTLRLIRVSDGEVVSVTTGQPVYKRAGLAGAFVKSSSELLGALSKAVIIVTSIPSDAGVVLDRTGKEACTTRCELRVEPGDHVIDVVKAGYQSYRKRVSVHVRERVKLHADLEKTGGGEDVAAQPTRAVPGVSFCDKEGFDVEASARVRQAGDCSQMAGLLKGYKKCRKKTKKQYRAAQERCVSTGGEAECEAERAARGIYDQEVREYRELVKRMRNLHCPGTPK